MKEKLNTGNTQLYIKNIQKVQELKEELTIEEIAIELDLKPEQVEEYLNYKIEKTEEREELEFKLKLTIKNNTLEKARKNKNLTQKQLAKLLNIDFQRYSQIENCRTYPFPAEKYELCKFAQIKEEILFPEWLEMFSTYWQQQENRVRIIPAEQMSLSNREVLALPSDDLEEIMRTTNSNVMNSVFKKVFAKVLTKKEQRVLEMRHGFNNGFYTNYPLGLEEVGKRLGVTRERIRQIEAKAHEKLKNVKEIQALNLDN